MTLRDSVFCADLRCASRNYHNNYPKHTMFSSSHHKFLKFFAPSKRSLTTTTFKPQSQQNLLSIITNCSRNHYSSQKKDVLSPKDQDIKLNESIDKQFHTTKNKLTWAQIADIAREQEEQYYTSKGKEIPAHLSATMALENLEGPLRIFCEGVLHFIDRNDLESAEETLEKAKAYNPSKTPALEPLFKILQSLIALEKKNYVGARAGLQQGLDMVGTRVSFDNCRIVIRGHLELARFYRDAFVPKSNAEKKERPDMIVKHANKAFMYAQEFLGWNNRFTIDVALEAARIDFSFNRVDMGVMILEKTLVALEFMSEEPIDVDTFTDIGTMLSRAYDRRKYYGLGESAIKRVQHLVSKRLDQFSDKTRLRQCLFKLENRRNIARFMHKNDHAALKKFQQLDDIAHEIGPKWIEANPHESLFEIALMKYFKSFAIYSVLQRGIKAQQESSQKNMKMGYVNENTKTKDMLKEGIVGFEGAKVLFEQLEDKHWIQECETMLSELKDQLNLSS